MIKSYEKLKKKEKQKYKVPKTAQDIVHVDVIHKDGIFQVGNKYTKTYRFSDINYAIASKEEKEGMYKGHTENYILVYYKSEENLENKMKKVICKEVEKNYIIAK